MSSWWKGHGRTSLQNLVSMLVACSSSLAVSGWSCAEVLVNEPFAYGNGPLVGRAPDPGPGAAWVAHTDEGNTPIQVSNGAAVLSQGSGSGGREDANIGFPVQSITATTYARFDFMLPSGQNVNPDLHGLVFAHIKSNRPTTHFRANTGVVAATGEGDFGLAVNANGLKLDEGSTWPTDLMFDTVYCVVTNWNSVTGEARLWLDPESESSPYISHTGHSTLQPMESYALRQSSDYTGTQIVDNIVVATSFAEALSGISSEGVAGDYNGNGIVDAADYTVWRDKLGNVGTPGIPGDGDDGTLSGTPDGTVDASDYAYWKTRFGATSGSGSAGIGSIRTAVPEPATGLAIGVAAMMLQLIRREATSRSTMRD